MAKQNKTNSKVVAIDESVSPQLPSLDELLAGTKATMVGGMSSLLIKKVLDKLEQFPTSNEDNMDM